LDLRITFVTLVILLVEEDLLPSARGHRKVVKSH